MKARVRKIMVTFRSFNKSEWLVIGFYISILWIGVVLAALIADAYFDKDTPPRLVAFAVIVSLLILVFYVLPAASDIRKPNKWRTLISFNAVRRLVFALMGLLASLTLVYGLIAPRSAVESETGILEETTRQTEEIARDTNERMRQIVPDEGQEPSIISEISGLWGEIDPPCELTWRIELAGEALVAEMIRRPEGVAPFRLIANITSTDRDTMRVVGEEPMSARGRAATFNYATNGVTERLFWYDESRDSERLELRRCG
ncbi:hypothetical protein HFP57_13390 [Parasphingopyxis algicola]|uniref:hypothetical protein n=1 Tax=Parasphingopyxis algicola TaxID=2026624 RepID=UPI0015A194D8|nr:hypothetical protein [Parasphingopyxis algicola]QLC25919.1 hypothetical protein HFP57_13390 [Parasphingopyxis algicola]